MALFGLGSCTQVNVDEAAPLNQKHSVSFASEIETVDTKGLDLVASPDWKGYIDENVHLYENDYEAESHTAIISDDWKTAYFTAVFGEEVIIDAPITKASKGYTYNGIMASGQDGVFTVPSVQAPTTDARIDPAADVLIGCALTFADPFTSSDQIYLGFVRPVAASRLSIVNIDKTDEDGASNALQSVTIYADSPLTGSFTYEDVDFADGSVAFDSTEGSKTITLNYSNEAVKSIQYAYFVCLPGKVHIEKVVVKTSKYIYTKTVDANTTFDAKKFKDIALDLKENTKREANAADPEKLDRTVEFAQASVTLTLGETFNAPELIGDVEGAVITWSSSDEAVATVDAEGKVEILAAGETTITASIAADDTYNAAEASYTITVSEPAPIVNKKFYKASAIEAGIEYVIVSNGQAIKNVEAENVDAAAVEVIDNTFEISEEDAASITWKAIAVTDTDLLQYGKYQFTNASEYLSRISGNSSTSVLKALPSTNSQISTKMKYTMWDYDGSHFVNISIYSTSTSNYYATYNDGWKIATTTGTADIYESRAPQTVSFSSTEAQYDLNPDAEAFVAPTLSGAQGAVTYSSSDETVATVASDGTITALKKGTATITAAVAGTDKYQAAVASYTLTVVDTTPVEGRTYVKVTSAPSNWSGTYLFVKESDNVAFAYNQSNYKVAVSISDNKIVSNECSDYELTVSTSSAGAGKYEIRTTNGMYVYRYGNTVLFDTNISGNNQYYALFSGDGNVTINCQRSGGSNNYFQYSSGAFGFGSSSNAAIQLYKLEEGGDTPDQPVEKTERNLAFSATTATAKIGAENTFPTLSGEIEGVSYTSNNEEVATVNPATGEITLVAAGETTITASAEEDDTYKAGNASYTLTVEAADVPTPGGDVTVSLKKATTLTPGKSYVLVSNGYAALNNGSAKDKVQVNDNTVTLPESQKSAIFFTLNGSETKGYTFTNGDDYFGIYMDINHNPYTYDVRVSATEAPSTNVSLTYLNKGAISSMLNGLIFYKGNNSSYYLYYDATNGWSNFKASNGSAVDSKYNTFLYEEVTGEGDTPVVTTAKYTKVSSLTEGKKYILVDLGENKAFKPILNSGKTGYLNNDKQNAIDVTVNDNTIVADEAVNACQISLQYQDASDKNKFGMVVTIDGAEYALHLNTTGSSVLVADDDTDGYRSTFTPSNGSFKITRKSSYTTYSFRYSASNDYFQVSTTSATEVALFEYSE